MKKNLEFKGKVVVKRGKRGNILCTLGKKYHFGKRGGGNKIIFWGNIQYTPLYLNTDNDLD